MPGEKPLETHFASPFYDGSVSVSRSLKESFGKTFDECEATLLIKAVLIVMDRQWDRFNRSSDGPGAEKWTWSTRRHRPQLVRDVEQVWCDLAEIPIEDDVFPFHESYVIRLWVEIRKFNADKKERLIALAKRR